MARIGERSKITLALEIALKSEVMLKSISIGSTDRNLNVKLKAKYRLQKKTANTFTNRTSKGFNKKKSKVKHRDNLSK